MHNVALIDAGTGLIVGLTHGVRRLRIEGGGLYISCWMDRESRATQSSLRRLRKLVCDARVCPPYRSDVSARASSHADDVIE
jgi:hypothetical protein